MDYTVSEILSFYNKISENLEKRYHNINTLNESEQLIDISGCLAVTNSVHEMFIKGILETHKKQHSFSSNKYAKLVRKFKSPAELKNFIASLCLPLDESFELYKSQLGEEFLYISSYIEIVEAMLNQRTSRNKTLHGEFRIDEKIEQERFKREILDFQRLHVFLLEIINYTYIKNYDALPNLSLSI